MKLLMIWLPVFSLLSLLAGHAGEPDEFCIVQDSDGYSNVREHPGTQSKIIARVDHGQVVWVYPGADKGWPHVIFMDKTGEELSGHIHKSRLKPLTAFESIVGKVFEDEQSEVFTKEGLKVEIKIEPFQRDGRELTYKEYSDGQRYLIEIDGEDYWGTDGMMPREQYKKITIQQNEETITLPDAALKNLFNPGLYPGNSKVIFNAKEKTIYLTSLNSDGAGGYVVAFVIQSGKYKSRTVLSPF